jgi:hypothetical protein
MPRSPVRAALSTDQKAAGSSPSERAIQSGRLTGARWGGWTGAEQGGATVDAVDGTDGLHREESQVRGARGGQVALGQGAQLHSRLQFTCV